MAQETKKKTNKTASKTPTKSKGYAKAPCADKDSDKAEKERGVALLKKKILFVASEASPYVRSGGLGDVAGALPKALKELNYDVRVIIPLYESISSDYKSLMKNLGNTYVPLGWRFQYAGVYQQTSASGITYYFIDNEYYFKRQGMYGHFDDAERFAFYSRAVLEALPIIDFYPDIIHANDWHTGLVPVFLDAFYRDKDGYRDIKTVYTIHNIQFQGIYDIYLIGDMLGLCDDKASLVEYNNCLNYMKGGIEAANAVTTVSETYACEILDPYFAYGLESILKERRYKISGIINGIDTEVFNPKKDKALFSNYDASSIENKAINKKGLLDMLRMKYDPKKPLIAMITRLTSQKGVDLVSAVIEDILTADIQFILLGTGDWKYETLFKEIEKERSAKFKAIINFSDDLASKIYAASDIFLMPSKFEPCGLGQLISMSYGAIPVVRETGGLKDTVEPYNPMTGTGTGFTFKTYNAHDMLNAIWKAVDTYYNRKADWEKITVNAMSKDYGWSQSALKYDELYKKL
ncbi:MAG: glycogen synthase GlgA [Christensenellales bacterium]|jgi:starch synthase